MDIILNYISVLPLSFYFATVYNYFIYQKKNDLILFIWLMITSLIIKLTKQTQYPDFFRQFTLRPTGAKNTDFLSRNGLVKLNTGFPSGHMTVTSFFTLYNILRSFSNDEKKEVKTRKIIIFIILNFLMAIARYFKRVHTIFQIISGFLLGCFLAFLAFYINSKIDKNFI